MRLFFAGATFGLLFTASACSHDTRSSNDGAPADLSLGTCTGTGNLTQCDSNPCCDVCQSLPEPCDSTITCYYGFASSRGDHYATCVNGKWMLQHNGPPADMSVLPD